VICVQKKMGMVKICPLLTDRSGTDSTKKNPGAWDE
jgi:hypothetical protein